MGRIFCRFNKQILCKRNFLEEITHSQYLKNHLMVKQVGKNFFFIHKTHIRNIIIKYLFR